MTREEAIAILNHAKGQTEYPHGAYGIALDMAIKALEQEPICPSHGIDCEDCPAYDPCGDVISRQAMHIELEKWITYGEYEYSNATKYLYDRIDRLPSVKPQEPKTGHWIEPTSDMIHNHICGSCEVICSSCNENAIDEYKYCPNCGAKMIDQ